MQEDAPSGTPSETIQVNPDEGFGPHMADAFLSLYGENSVFVTATVDCLTRRFINVLIKADKLPPDSEPVQYGAVEMREALESFLQTLSARGSDRPSIALMRSAVGHEQPQTFQRMAAALLGSDLVDRWLRLLEQEDYAGASALLAVH